MAKTSAGKPTTDRTSDSERQTSLETDMDPTASTFPAVPQEDNFAEAFKKARGSVDQDLELGFPRPRHGFDTFAASLKPDGMDLRSSQPPGPRDHSMETAMQDDHADFLASLKLEKPPAPITAPLRAIWHGLRREWDEAHEIVQAESDPESAWVHAWLHRIEGDLSNARYWYSRAGRPMPGGATGEEGAAIAAALLREWATAKP